MACEITVTVKDEEKTLKTKFLIYDQVVVDENDLIIQNCINQVLKNFATEPTDIRVRINLEVR